MVSTFFLSMRSCWFCCIMRSLSWRCLSASSRAFASASSRCHWMRKQLIIQTKKKHKKNKKKPTSVQWESQLTSFCSSACLCCSSSSVRCLSSSAIRACSSSSRFLSSASLFSSSARLKRSSSASRFSSSFLSLLRHDTSGPLALQR